MRILVTGAAGQVGSELPPHLERAGAEVVAFGRDDLDLTDPDAIRSAVAAAAPDAVVNCAAYNAVDRAEDEPETAMAVNADAPGVLAETCAARGAHLVHISTDYVFAGDKGAPYDETDEPAPLSAYARSKLAGEQAVRAAGGAWTIVRTALVFGRIGRSLVELILDRARAGEPLRMVDDQRGSPTHAGDLAGVLATMATRRVQGLFHVTNAGGCTPYELSGVVLEAAGVTSAAVERVTTEELGRPARRPADSALVSVRLAGAGIAPLRPYREAVQERVQQLVAAGGTPA